MARSGRSRKERPLRTSSKALANDATPVSGVTGRAGVSIRSAAGTRKIDVPAHDAFHVDLVRHTAEPLSRLGFERQPVVAGHLPREARQPGHTGGTGQVQQRCPRDGAKILDARGRRGGIEIRVHHVGDDACLCRRLAHGLEVVVMHVARARLRVLRPPRPVRAFGVTDRSISLAPSIVAEKNTAISGWLADRGQRLSKVLRSVTSVERARHAAFTTDVIGVISAMPLRRRVAIGGQVHLHAAVRHGDQRHPIRRRQLLHPASHRFAQLVLLADRHRLVIHDEHERANGLRRRIGNECGDQGFGGIGPANRTNSSDLIGRALPSMRSATSAALTSAAGLPSRVTATKSTVIG